MDRLGLRIVDAGRTPGPAALCHRAPNALSQPSAAEISARAQTSAGPSPKRAVSPVHGPPAGAGGAGVFLRPSLQGSPSVDRSLIPGRHPAGLAEVVELSRHPRRPARQRAVALLPPTGTSPRPGNRSPELGALAHSLRAVEGVPISPIKRRNTDVRAVQPSH
jgi:hypothetical protein